MQELEPLRELAGRWPHTCTPNRGVTFWVCHRCQLESLIPAIEAAAELLERERLQWEKDYKTLLSTTKTWPEQMDKLRAEVANWKDIAKQAHGVTEEQRAEIAALKTQGPCGIHPKACWKECPNPDVCPCGGHCIACAKQGKAKRLERAAALPSRERLAKLLFEIDNKPGDAQWPEDWKRQPYCQSSLRNADKILAALLSDPDRSALDAFKAEAIEQCAIEAGERSPEGVSSHSILGDMWDARIRALRGSK